MIKIGTCWWEIWPQLLWKKLFCLVPKIFQLIWDESVMSNQILPMGALLCGPSGNYLWIHGFDSRKASIVERRFCEKDLKVNMLKAKQLVCGRGLSSFTDSGKYPCGVYCKSVGVNSVYCWCYHHWVNKRCKKLSVGLTAAVDFKCQCCLDMAPTSKWKIIMIDHCSWKISEEVKKWRSGWQILLPSRYDHTRGRLWSSHDHKM